MSKQGTMKRLNIRKISRKQKDESTDPKQPTTTMRDIETKFLVMSYHADPKYICQCEICQKEVQVLTRREEMNSFIKLKETADAMLQRKSNIKCLLKFLTPKKGHAGLRIQIPQICFYEDGQPSSIFMTSKEEVKMFKPAKLTNRQVLHTFLQQKRLYKQALRQKYESSIVKHIDFQEIHEKYLQSILPVFKPGGTEKQKGFRYLRIHKDNRLMMDSLVKHQNNDTDEVCLIRRLDGTFQLMNETQFITLMGGRGASSDIELIQSYIRPKSQSNCMIHSEYYCTDRIANKLLYERAEQEVDIVLEIISPLSPNYISREASEEFETVLRQNPQDYALYQTYKIVKYITKTADIKTLRLKLSWLINDIDLFYLYAVAEFDFEEIQFEDDKLTKLEMERAKHEMKHMENVQKWLIDKWEGIKKAKDIDNEHLVPKPPNRSKDVFEMLHPGINFDQLIAAENFEKRVYRITEQRRRSLHSQGTARKKSLIETQHQSPKSKSYLRSTWARTRDSPFVWGKGSTEYHPSPSHDHST